MQLKPTLNMRLAGRLLLLILTFAEVTKMNSAMGEGTNERIPEEQNNRTRTLTKVVNHAFCNSDLTEEDKMAKKTLEEVHTYAELKYDPHVSLPDSFTICSTTMTTSCPSTRWPTFFALLDNNRTLILAPAFKPGSISSHLLVYFHKGTKEKLGQISPLFPNQWIRSCMAINLVDSPTQLVCIWIFIC